MGLVLLLVLTVLPATLGASFPGADDRIVALPGVPTMPRFNMYSGYLDINVTSGKRFFYFFVEGTQSTTQPLVRWFNGGPGCSSVGGGGFEENGPFIPDENGGLAPNPTSWNQFANMLYIESPVGVGFSYSKSNSDYTSSDDSTANGDYVAMLAWLAKFPHYTNRDLYLMGESYAGHYIPTLVTKMLDKPLPFNFKGFATGNPTTSIVEDFFFGSYQTWAMRGLISSPTWNQIQQYCSGNITFLQPPANCQNALNAAQSEMGNKINPYDLDVPMCPAEEQRRVRMLLAKVTQSPPFLPYDPCEDGAVARYLNRQDVQLALHVAVGSVGNWSDCTSDPRWNYQYNDFYNVQVPVYQRAMKLPLQILVYSGTADTVVPYLGTQRWIWNMMGSAAPTLPWQSWSTPSALAQTAGYQVGWGNFRFVTIRNAGHLVPQTSPLQGLSIMRFLLFGQP